MLTQRLTSAIKQFNSIASILNGANRARERDVPYGFERSLVMYGDVDLAYWKAFDHCAAVVRCYATFERFVLSAVEEWVKWCLMYQPELVLASKSARDLYEAGLAEIVRRKADTRFSDIDKGKLARGMTLFYGSKPLAHETLPVAPFFAAQPNLRIQHINDLCSHVGLSGATKWLSAAGNLREFCEEEGFSFEEEVRQLVERRNEAAHGNGLPADILGTNELMTRIQLLKILCISIQQFVLIGICRSELGEAYDTGLLGRITHTWPAANAVELTLVGTTIQVGTSVGVVAGASFYAAKVESIHYEGQATVGYSGNSGDALGIRFSHLPPKGARILDLSGVRGIGELLAV